MTTFGDYEGVSAITQLDHEQMRRLEKEDRQRVADRQVNEARAQQLRPKNGYVPRVAAPGLEPDASAHELADALLHDSHERQDERRASEQQTVADLFEQVKAVHKQRRI